jgi:hypothetical protein
VLTPLSRIASLSGWAALGFQRTKDKLVVRGRLDLAEVVGVDAVGSDHEGSDATGACSGASRLSCGLLVVGETSAGAVASGR